MNTDVQIIYFLGSSSSCRFYDASCADCISGGSDCVWCSDEVRHIAKACPYFDNEGGKGTF